MKFFRKSALWIFDSWILLEEDFFGAEDNTGVSNRSKKYFSIMFVSIEIILYRMI